MAAKVQRQLLVLTLMACPKKPFPRTSPWIRSQGRKICCEQLLEQRRDSERLISRLRSRGSLGELGPGDLEMLLLRLRVRREQERYLYRPSSTAQQEAQVDLAGPAFVVWMVLWGVLNQRDVLFGGCRQYPSQ